MGTLQPRFAVRLVGAQAEPLQLVSEGGIAVAQLRSASLNQGVVARWLERHRVPLLSDSVDAAEALPTLPLSRVRTSVVCADPRVQTVAALYAQCVGAPLRFAQTPEEVSAAIEESEPIDSISLFLLSDRLEEALCQAASTAARLRNVAYGFLSAFTSEHLAWLVIKTLALFLRPFPDRAGFANWSFSTPQSAARIRKTRNGATQLTSIDAPWIDDSIAVLGVRAHGAPFDVSLGPVVLCGHLDPDLPPDRTRRAPSCFHDGVCFRMKSDDGPIELLRAVHASPLVWCLDSCASVPFRGNAFGEGTSYAFGLIAGAAVGVIGPFLDIITGGEMTRNCEALLATGATLGETAAAACSLEQSSGFDKFLLIGSPDLRLLPPNTIEGEREGDNLRYRVRGERQYAWRLAVPADLTPSVYVVGDDGGPHWAGAQCRGFDLGGMRELVVTLDEPVDVDGWLFAGSGGVSNETLSSDALQIENNLKVLALYPFASHASKTIAQCRKFAASLRRIAGAPHRLRSRVDATMALANLLPALDSLHREIASGFLSQVAAHDLNLDRLANIGFDREATERTTRRCPACGLALYVTRTRWRSNRLYARDWVQCANCSGIMMVLDDSPLEIQPPAAISSAGKTGLFIALDMRNRTDAPVEVLVAGLARQAPLTDAAGPVTIIVPPSSPARLHFDLPFDSSRPGVISYRLLVLCRAGVELFALKHVVESAISQSAGEAARLAHPVFAFHEAQ